MCQNSQYQQPGGWNETMSFSLWPWLAEGHPIQRKSRSGVNAEPGDACRNPRTIRRSGCAPAEPYPPNRNFRVTSVFCLAKDRVG